MSESYPLVVAARLTNNSNIGVYSFSDSGNGAKKADFRSCGGELWGGDRAKLQINIGQG